MSNTERSLIEWLKSQEWFNKWLGEVIRYKNEQLKKWFIELVEKYDCECVEAHGCNSGMCIKKTAKEEMKKQLLIILGDK